MPLPDIVHVHAPGAPGVIRYHVDELAGVIDEEGTRRDVGDGVFEEGTGFQIEETLLVAFVTLLVYGDAQQFAATGRLEATKEKNSMSLAYSLQSRMTTSPSRTSPGVTVGGV